MIIAPTLTPQVADSVSEFLQTHGFNQLVPFDGRFHRYVHSCGPGDAGWAIFSESVVPRGTIGCHRCGLRESWVGVDRELTDEERKQIAKADAGRAKEDLERQEGISKCLTEVILPELPYAPDDHPYLRAKNVKAHGARTNGTILILPLQDATGRIWSAEGISAEPVKKWRGATKHFEPGGRITACFYAVGDLKGATRLLICEGFATGATLFEATGVPAVCAMAANNLMAVARTMRSKFPNATITICADSDRHTEGNPGMAYADAAALAVGAAFVVPDFTGFPADKAHSDFNDLAREKGIELVRTIVLEKVPPPRPLCYYDLSSQGWWSLDGARFIPVSEMAVKRHLHIGGVGRVAKGDNPTPLDLEMDRLIHTGHVDYAGAIAGWPRGLSTQAGRRVLVTENCPLPKAGAGAYPVLSNLFIAAMGKYQFSIYMALLHLLRRRIILQAWHPLPAIAFVGAKNSCKSLAQGGLTHALGGRSAKPGLFMQGGTPFNGHLFGAEHLMLEDETAKKDALSRRHLGEAIKTMLFCRTVFCHPKGRPGLSLEPYWAISMSINSEPEHLMVLPPMDDSLLDKLIILKLDHTEREVPPGRNETEWLTEVLIAEMPSLLADVDKLDLSVWPSDMLDSRTVLRAWQHPDIMTQIGALTPEAQLLAHIDDVVWALNPGVPMPWIGSAEMLSRKLRESSFGREVEKLLSWPAACGVYLGRLASQHPERVIRFASKREWKIFPYQEPAPDPSAVPPEYTY